MIDNDGDKDNDVNDNGANKTATIDPVKDGDPHFKIHPTSPTSHLPTITAATEVPLADDIFLKYLTPGTIMNNGTKHHFRVSSALCINKLKHILAVYAHLDNSKIYITHNNI